MTDFPPPTSPQALQYSSQPELPKGMAIASMVCGICSIPFLCIWYLAIPAAIVAVVLGFIARAKAKRGEAAGSGMAMAGIICGSVALLLVVLAVSAFAYFLTSKHGLRAMMPMVTPSPTSAPTPITRAMPASMPR